MFLPPNIREGETETLAPHPTTKALAAYKALMRTLQPADVI